MTTIIIIIIILTIIIIIIINIFIIIIAIIIISSSSTSSSFSQSHTLFFYVIFNQDFADSLGLSFIETSAKSSSNVEKAFIHMTSQIKERYIVQSTLKYTTTNITNSSIYLNGQSITSQQNMKGCCF